MASEESRSEAAFVLQDAFADVKDPMALAPGSPDVLASSALIALDTSTLLLPYSTQSKSLGLIVKTLMGVAKQNRLIVPAHAVREFVRQRPYQLANVHHALRQRSDRVSSVPLLTPYPFLAEVPAFKDVEAIEREIRGLAEKHRMAVERVLGELVSASWRDPVSTAYSGLFAKALIRDVSLSREDLAKDLARRAKSQLPPGYKDGSKDTNAAGDLIIWHTLLEAASEAKADLLFITSEAKPDWWVLSDKQTLWPRSELVAEFHRRTGGQRFAIADLSVLLRALKAPEAVINEVVRAETIIYARPEDAAVVSIMREWLKAVYSLQEGPAVSANLRCDFVLYRDGKPVPVEVKLLRRPTDLGVISKGTILLDRVRESLGGARAILCLVYSSVISARRAKRAMRLGRHLPPKVEVVIGILREDGFVEVVTEAEE